MLASARRSLVAQMIKAGLIYVCSKKIVELRLEEIVLTVALVSVLIALCRDGS